MEKEGEEEKRVVWKTERVVIPKGHFIYNSDVTISTETMWDSSFVRTAMQTDTS